MLVELFLICSVIVLYQAVDFFRCDFMYSSENKQHMGIFLVWGLQSKYYYRYEYIKYTSSSSLPAVYTFRNTIDHARVRSWKTGLSSSPKPQ